MARAAVLPPSPVKRGARAAPRTTKTTKAKTAAAPRNVVRPNLAASMNSLDSDDTDDELGMMMEEDTAKAARPRGRPAGRPATKAAPKTAPARTKKAAPAAQESQVDDEGEEKPEPVKKRVGRPKKTSTAEPSKPAAAAPKPRGRPKADPAAKKATTTRKAARIVDEPSSSAEKTDPKHIVINTNSTTMRSNLLRGPAKKKTVTFQDVSDSESEEVENAAVPATGRRKAAGKAGLGATPMRKATGATRGRKPAAKKDMPQPLSPKKTKQIAKSLGIYTESEDDEDELTAAKADAKSPVKLVVQSPVKHTDGSGSSSPVRRINFTPKKASSQLDENGEPKTITPKHGSSTIGLSPVRKINFTPNRSQQTVVDNGHLALPPGSSFDFTSSMMLSSPARRPEASPFKFSVMDTPARNRLYREELETGYAQDLFNGPASPLKLSPKKGHLGASFQAPQTGPAPALFNGPASPLKMSPKKGHLGASFQGPAKSATPSFQPKASFIQSPAKRVASPFKNSLFASGSPARKKAPSPIQETTETREDAENLSGSVIRHRLSFHREEEDEPEVDHELSMVEEVARDIFGIELSSSQHSVQKDESPHQELEREPLALSDDEWMEPDNVEIEERTVDQKLEDLQAEIQREPDDFATLCFKNMEDLQKPFEPLSLADDDDEEDEANDLEQDQVLEEPVAEAAESVREYTPSLPSSPAQELAEADPFLDVDPDTDVLHPIQEPLSPASVHETPDVERYEQENTETLVQKAMDIRDDYEVEEAGSDENQTDNDRSPSHSAANVHLSRAQSPSEHFDYEDSPLRSIRVPPTAPTPPAEGSPSMSPQESAKSSSRIFDFNTDDARFEYENSPFEFTETDIPTPAPPSLAGTPHTRRHSNFNVDMGFTPLADQFGLWETNTPEARQGRPRRRGVFSLVGPLDRSGETHIPDEGEVSYPDLSRPSLANTPRLFAELPLQPHDDQFSPTPASISAAESPLHQADHDMIDSPSKTDVFEDNETICPENQSRFSLSGPTLDQDQDPSSEEEEDKENLAAPPSFPATPVRPMPDSRRTVHTISKVPLKGEGEVSPLKMPRKRGLSLSATSPSRVSPRSRKPIFFPRSESVHILSPPKTQVNRSPSPKRHCSVARRSSARSSMMPPPRSPSVASSSGKSHRRKSSVNTSKQVLKGAVVHVNVHTTEGEDASGIFVELLQQMGARCVKSWSWNPRASASPVDGQDPMHTQAKVGITHVVYKDGNLRTLEKVKSAGGLVKCVGVGWVLE